MIDGGKHNLLGVRVDAVDYRACVERIVAAAKARQPLTVSALAVHGLMTGALDPVHRYRLNSFDLLAPDGQPVRWALNRLHKARLRERVYGPNLMLALCEAAANEQLPIFLYGATTEMLAGLRRNLLDRFPRLPIAGMQPSRFRRLQGSEPAQVAEQIRASGAALTFIGLGCPRQEVWAFEYRDALSMPLIAVGAAFAFHAGELPQAPRWMQNWGLEWFYRLMQEPKRLWRRYLLLNPAYASLIALQYLRLRRFDPFDAHPPQEAMNYG